jgi:beta-lactamase regulating signal transducer with metallopeptidase domain
LPNTNTAFSFFKSIFLGEQLSEIQKANILLHEKIHIDQHHSIDLLFFEVLRILFWFNPLVYVYQKKMILLQEFTADAKVAAIKGKRHITRACYRKSLTPNQFHLSIHFSSIH